MTASKADLPILAASAAALGSVAAVLAHDGAWRSAALLLVAAALGWVFLTTNFGFTGAFRGWMTRRDDFR